jgi:DNA (cytosine-5)-methyltransferase 1
VPKRFGYWKTEPGVSRVVDGVPSRLDRLRCLGNAVVPQIVEVIGRAIVTGARA